MRTRWIRLAALAILAAGMAAASAGGAEGDLSARLDDLSLTNSVAGNKLADEAFKGRVVLVEFWGIN